MPNKYGVVKTRIVFEVLHPADQDLNEYSLHGIVRECDEGDFSGYAAEFTTEDLSEDAFRRECYMHGTDPSFFFCGDEDPEPESDVEDTSECSDFDCNDP